MATSRRMPSSYNTSTYDSGDGTKDYTALSTWEAATDIDLVSASSGEVLECYDSQDHDDSVTLFGATANSSYFRVVKPASGEGHDGTENNGVHFHHIGANYVINLDETNGQIHDLICSRQYTGIYNYLHVISLRKATNVFTGCIVSDCTGSKSNQIGMGIYNGTAVNCIVHMPSQTSTWAAFSISTGGGAYYNCTSVGNSTGFRQNGTPAIAKNCISCDNATDFSGTWSKTTCYEGDATVFADQAADDYHLDSTDTTARGNGTDLSSDGTYAFDDDIDGTTRSAWDIGADEYAAAGWSGKCLNVSSIARINNVAVADIAKVNAVA